MCYHITVSHLYLCLISRLCGRHVWESTGNLILGVLILLVLRYMVFTKDLAEKVDEYVFVNVFLNLHAGLLGCTHCITIYNSSFSKRFSHFIKYLFSCKIPFISWKICIY